MQTPKSRTLFLYGFLTWLTPFLVSLPLMSPSGEPVIDLLFFKKIMLLVGASIGTFLLVRCFRSAERPGVGLGAKVGSIWLLMNLLLDVVILLPLSGMPVLDWLTGIGIGYFSIPIVAVGMGMVAEDARAKV